MTDMNVVTGVTVTYETFALSIQFPFVLDNPITPDL